LPGSGYDAAMADSTQSSSDRPTLYLIDGHAQFFRAYHAIRAPMSSPVTGEPTQMTFSFMGMLLKLLRDYRPDYLAVVIDVAGDKETFRSALYPEYKANRDAPPDDFHPQVERCLKLLEQFSIPVYGMEEVEADDVIGTIVERLHDERPELAIEIVSRDKDLTQLLRDRVTMLDPMKDEHVTPAAIFKTEGVEPSQVIDMLALMGDTSDNVPGVPGIGPKTAAKLIMEYGSIEGLLEHLDDLKGKRRENIEASKDMLPLSRQLVTLRTDLDVDFDLEAARWSVADVDAAAALQAFKELGFNQMQKQLGDVVGVERAAGPESGDGAKTSGGLLEEGSLFAAVEAGDAFGAAAALEDRISFDACLVTTRKDLDALITRLKKAKRFAVDTETTSLRPREAELCGISVAVEPGEAWYVPIRSPEPESHLDQDTVVEAFRPVLEDDSIAKLGHNLKYDLVVLRSHGMDLGGPLIDTMIASYVADATRSSHKLDVLALAMLNHACIPITELLGTGKKQKRFDEVPLGLAGPYAAEDAEVVLRLWDRLEAELRQLGLMELFETVEMPLVPVLAELEFNGITVDRAELERQRSALSGKTDELREQILNASPLEFNPDSPKQLAAVPVQQAGRCGDAGPGAQGREAGQDRPVHRPGGAGEACG
jgi:DNA polymerase-1